MNIKRLIHTWLPWTDDSYSWNPFNKVYQSHRYGTIDHKKTNFCRDLLGLPTPWTPEMGEREVRLPQVPSPFPAPVYSVSESPCYTGTIRVESQGETHEIPVVMP